MVKDIHHYGHGISYDETIFIQDKWAEWCEKQSSLIPSNIESRKLVTHVVNNIDWENKGLTGDQTHHTNSIIIQESTDSRNDIPSVALEPDYNFKRSEHKSFKGTQFNLPNIIFKRSEAKLLEYESDGEISIDNNETKISNSRNLLWAFLRINKMGKIRKVKIYQAGAVFRDSVENRHSQCELVICHLFEHHQLKCVSYILQ